MKSNRRDWSRRISKQAKALAELLENFTDDESAMLQIRRNLISQHEAVRCGLAQAGDNGSSSEHCQALLMMLA
jgi:hypothetical protein